MLKKINNDILDLWDKLRKSEISRINIYKKIELINEDIKNIRQTPMNIKNLYDFSQNLLDLYNLLTLSENLDNDLKITGIILRNQLKKPVYYIINKEAIKMFATNIPWFFQTYNKAKLIKESSSYVLLKEEKISSLAFTANIILNENKKAIYEKYHKEESAREFYKNLSL